jgi:gas vesicle protein
MDNGSGGGLSLGSFFLGMLAGAVVGGVTAVMLTPKSGPETRELIKNRMVMMKDAVCSGTPGNSKQAGQP